MSKVTEKNNSREYIVAIIGIFGVIIGGLLTYWITINQQSKVAKYEYEKYLFEKRIELIDKATKIFGQKPAVVDTWENYIINTKFDTILKKSLSNPELSEKLGNYKSEYQTTILLIGLFFGPKTNKTLSMYNTPDEWRTVNQKFFDTICINMQLELTYNLKEFEKTILNK